MLISVGGGGLIGGMAAWYAGRTRIIAVEPLSALTLHRAFEAGMPVDAEAGGAAALAAVLSGEYRISPKERVGIILCGGNTVAVDFSRQTAH